MLTCHRDCKPPAANSSNSSNLVVVFSPLLFTASQTRRRRTPMPTCYRLRILLQLLRLLLLLQASDAAHCCALPFCTEMTGTVNALLARLITGDRRTAVDAVAAQLQQQQPQQQQLTGATAAVTITADCGPSTYLAADVNCLERSAERGVDVIRNHLKRLAASSTS